MFKLWAVLLVFVALMVSGCVTTGDLFLNDQNIKAGRFIASTATQPEVQQAGRDVAENSMVLVRALGEAGSDAAAYSAEASAQLRGQAQTEHQNVQVIKDLVWDKVKDFIPGWLLAILGAAFGLIQTVAKKLSDKKKTDQISALVSGVQSVRARVQESWADKKLTAAEIDQVITAVLQTKQAAYNVWPDIKEIIASLKSTGEIKPVS